MKVIINTQRHDEDDPVRYWSEVQPENDLEAPALHATGFADTKEAATHEAKHWALAHGHRIVKVWT